MLRGILTIGIGLCAGVLAIVISQLELRYAIAVSTAVSAATVMVCLGSSGSTSLALLSAMAFTIPINISSTLFLYSQAPDHFVPHVGGASGVTLSIPLLAALGIAVVQMVTKPEYRILSGPRLEPLATSGALLFFVAGVISLINAADAKLVGFELLRIATLFLLMFLMMSLKDRGIDQYLHSLAVAVLVQGLLAVTQYASGTTFGLEVFQNVDSVPELIDYALVARAAGTMGNANFLAYFLEITLPMLLALSLTTKRRALRILYVSAFIAGLGGIVCTLSRGSWISLPFTLGAVFVLFVGQRIWSLKAAFLGVFLCFAVILVGVAAGPVVIKRITADDAGSTDSRAPLNAAAWSMIRQFPVTGVGLNNFGDAFPRYDQHGGARLLRGPNHVVHNMYLLIWGETGIIGLLAFLWYFGAAFLLAVFLFRRSPDLHHRAIAAGAAFGLLAHLVHGLFDPGFRMNLPISTLIACQIGLLAAMRLRPMQSASASHATERPPLDISRQVV